MTHLPANAEKQRSLRLRSAVRRGRELREIKELRETFLKRRTREDGRTKETIF
jgi:hypothetical protein